MRPSAVLGSRPCAPSAPTDSPSRPGQSYPGPPGKGQVVRQETAGDCKGARNHVGFSCPTSEKIGRKIHPISIIGFHRSFNSEP